MRKWITVIIVVCLVSPLLAPPNCEIYKEDQLCYEACQEAMTAIRFPQGYYKSQEHFDRSIELCPTLAYSWMEKAVPYLKRGLFVEWKALIDQAVALDPAEYLGYRGWCRLQFLRDYEGAIEDIDQLKSLVKYDIGYCQTGDYHLNFAQAFCYKALGDFDLARALMTEQLNSKNYSKGLYDFYHLGVLEYETGHYETAVDYFTQQIEFNDHLAGTHFYLALTQKALGNIEAYTHHLNKAEVFYDSGKVLTDPYTEPFDKVYLMDILEEKNRATSIE